ncbi:hypothetical protein CVU76_00880 [Candidatus Dojkabacteria bacterium HGW-Dojkabacteria-1]|uniref:Uncharacterized protein n=1 Tax=Candidatus Dojkabacteria bacterium HGW-Dojkabacteria-1 TaxID=2013761 RepID=A0A2N2F326_9BACT|nr:MAG: hypothetical protein CVU76_00880 [Candidatus Dojkabacteria bacterium HGW-Dojkabacteria-1]
MSIEDEIYQDCFGDDDDFDKELDQEVIEDLAMDYIWGEVTDDNPSTANGLSGLEQVIAYAFDLAQDDKKTIRKLKYRVYARVSELNGGCDMSSADSFSLQD